MRRPESGHPGAALPLALLLLLLPAGRAPATSPAAPVARDDLGRTVALPGTAKRVVALSPAAVELLFAVGAGDVLAGVPAEADYPPEARGKPKVGTFSNPDEEAIVALRPDLAVVAHGNPEPLVGRLQARGIPVFVSHPRRVSDILEAMRALGNLTGNAQGGAQAAEEFQQRLDAVHDRVRDRPPVPAALLVWDDPITVAGAGAFLHDALSEAGAENVAGAVSQPYPTIDPERFAAWNPQVILFAGHDARRVRDAAARPGIRATAAAREGRVAAVHEDLALRPGPRLIEAIEAMARALHPGAFAAPAAGTAPEAPAAGTAAPAGTAGPTGTAAPASPRRLPRAAGPLLLLVASGLGLWTLLRRLRNRRG
jgi:iron complex transport system substrate-binding protein